MKLRVAIIGCGAVGAIHAARLSGQHEQELTAIYSPDPEHAKSLAARCGAHVAASSVEEAVSLADVAILCSPSHLHFEQAQACLRAGRHTLVELPPCGNPDEADELGAIARQKGVLLGCAHTSRYLEPYARLHTALQSGVLGQIREITYIRYPQLPPRTWIDDALLHHAAHVIDLAMTWCGGLEPLACVAFPKEPPAQSVSLVAALPAGNALTAAVSYGAKFPFSRMIVVAENHTAESDGFSYLTSDRAELQFSGNAREVYEQAIAAQDRHFFEACLGKAGYIPWAETEDLMRMIQRFQALKGLAVVSQD